MKKIAYIRVSTPDQCHDRQVLGLKGICDELYIETLSACSAHRPVYDKAVAQLTPGNMLVVWDLDRAFRSTIDALTEAEKLRARGVHFQVATFSIDTSTPIGIFIYTMVSALAELERRTLSQRTKEGLKAARERGKRIGRPPILTEAQLEQARTRLEGGGLSINRLAAEMDVPSWTLARSLRRAAGRPPVDMQA